MPECRNCGYPADERPITEWRERCYALEDLLLDLDGRVADALDDYRKFMEPEDIELLDSAIDAARERGRRS